MAASTFESRSPYGGRKSGIHDRLKQAIRFVDLRTDFAIGHFRQNVVGKAMAADDEPRLQQVPRRIRGTRGFDFVLFDGREIGSEFEEHGLDSPVRLPERFESAW